MIQLPKLLSLSVDQNEWKKNKKKGRRKKNNNNEWIKWRSEIGCFMCPHQMKIDCKTSQTIWENTSIIIFYFSYAEKLTDIDPFWIGKVEERRKEVAETWNRAYVISHKCTCDKCEQFNDIRYTNICCYFSLFPQNTFMHFHKLYLFDNPLFNSSKSL